MNPFRGKVGEEAGGLSKCSIEYAVDLGELSVIEDSEVCSVIFRFEELLNHKCFVGRAQFPFCEGFCEFSNILGDVGVVFSGVHNGIDVNPDHFVLFVRWEVLGV